MRKNLFVFLLVLPMILSAQIQWQNNGIPVWKAENINWKGTGTTILDGSNVIVWRDSRTESNMVYAQKIDALGNLLWGEGINISNTYSIIFKPVIAAASDGGVFVAWQYKFYNMPDYFISVQKISPQGDLLWSDTGISWALESNFDYPIYLTPDQAGGVFVSWNEKNLYQIKCKLLQSDGSPAPGWDESGNTILSYPDFSLLDLAFGLQDEQLLFVYNITNYNSNVVYMQKINAAGNPQWGVSGLLISSNENYKRDLNLLTSSTGFWVGWRYNQIPILEIYRFHSDGSLFWTDPLVLNSNADAVSKLVLVSDEENNLYAGWSDYFDNGNCDIRIAKTDSAQNLLWGNQGIIALSTNENDYDFGLEFVDNLNFICAINNSDSNLYFDQFNASGISTLTQPLVIRQFTGKITKPLLLKQNENQSFISWLESASGQDAIRYQILNNDNQPILTTGGEIAFSGISGQVWNTSSLSLGNTAAVSWEVNDSGDIFLQLFDNNGILLAENGVPIAENEFSTYNKHSMIFDEVNNTVILSRQRNSGTVGEVYLQSIDMDGNLLWGANGLVPTNSDWIKWAIHTSARNGFVYAAWSESNGDWLYPVIEVFANKIDASGNLLWGEGGIQISDADRDDVAEDVCGTFFLWRNEVYPNYTLHAILLDENGNTAAGWNEDGLLISEISGSNIEANITEMDVGYLITWHNLPVIGNRAIWGQLVTEDGELLWGENGIQLAEIEDYPGSNSNTKVYFDDFIYLIWNDVVNYEPKVCMQKIDLAGNLLWPGNGVFLPAEYCTDYIRIYDYTLIVTRTGDFNNIEARLYNDAGEELWSAILCNEIFPQIHPKVTLLGENNILISWLDSRAGIIDPNYFDPVYTGIYAQNIFLEPTSTPEEILSAIKGKLTNYPNPFNPSTTISFSIEQNEQNQQVELSIFNIKGQKVKTLIDAVVSATEISCTWNGKDENGKRVSSGEYLARLTINGEEKAVRKMMVVK
jgi:hypothetical protein